MYELIILGLLMQQPAHGYLLVQIINDMIGPWAKVSNGTIYPMLAKLEERGYVSASAPEPGERDRRGSRTLEITEAGRERFHQLMMDTTSNPMDYQRIFRFKVHCLEFLPIAERRHLLDHYAMYCQAHILHMRKEAAEFPSIPGQLRILFWAAKVMAHLITEWQSELDWVNSIRPLLLAAGAPAKEQA